MKKLLIIPFLILAIITFAYSAVNEGRATISSTATLIVPANAQRRGLWFMNTGASKVYIGTTSSVDTTYPYLVPTGSIYIDNPDEYRGSFYGITSSGSSYISYSER